MNGTCPCGSLCYALQNLTSNSIINITSESVTLNTTTPIGSGNLQNITITGNGATIMCNNSGGVYCESCSDVIIEGITWDQCGDPNKDNVVAGIHFTDIHNFKIERCFLQGFKICAVSLDPGYGEIIVKSTIFQFNVMEKSANSFDGSGLKIHPETTNTSILISNSTFNGNGYFDNLHNQSYYGLYVEATDDTLLYFSLTISKTKFLSNSGGACVYIDAANLAPIILNDLIFFNNTNRGIWFPSLNGPHIFLTLSNSSFTNNKDGGIIGTIVNSVKGNYIVNIVLEHSNFTNNSAATAANNVVGFHIATTDNSAYIVSIQHCKFLNNINGTVNIFTTESRTSCNLVLINEVLVMGSQTIGSPAGGGAVSVVLNGLWNNTFRITNVQFISNNYTGIAGGALYIATANTENDVHISNCLFQGNVALGEGAAFYLLDGNTGSSGTLYVTRIRFDTGSRFINNSGGNSVIYISAGSIFTTIFVDTYTLFANNNGTAMHLLSSNLTFADEIVFSGNSANNGGALYVERGTRINFDNGWRKIHVLFQSNFAAQYGGAIYVDLSSGCSRNGVLFYSNSQNFRFS